jgi:hypothetical protein
MPLLPSRFERLAIVASRSGRFQRHAGADRQLKVSCSVLTLLVSRKLLGVPAYRARVCRTEFKGLAAK